MKLNKLMFKNFLSYGNNNTTFEFNEVGMYLISGDNGFGKSVLLEALCFVLYDKSMRPIKKGELINWDNEKGLYVEVEFESNDKLYKIERGLKPTIFNIYEDGEKLENLSSKALTQNYLETHILCYSHEEFIGSSMLTNMTEVIPKLTAANKRKFFENMFNIGVVDVMKTKFKTKLTNVNKRINLLISNNEKNKGLKEGLEETIKEIDILRNKMIDENNITIENNKTIIDDNEEIILGYKKKLNSFKTRYNKNLLTYEKKEKGYNLRSNRVLIKKEEKKFLESHDNCNSCNQEIDKEFKKSQILKIDKYIKEKTDEMSKVDIKSMKKKLDNQYNKINKLDKEISILENNNKIYKKENIILSNEINNADKEFNKESKDKKLNSIIAEITSNEEDIAEMNVKIAEYEYIIQKMFSDDGIRKYVLSQYMDYLNDNIADILEILEIDFDVYINDDMDIMVEKMGKKVNYFGLSAGQQRMVNFAIMLTIIKIRKIAFPNGFNVLFLDEYIDTALSEESVEKMADTLNNLKTKLFGNDILYVISHRLNNHTEIFDKKFEVTYEDNFSEIIEKI